METNLINIKLIKLARNPKERYLYPSYKLSITNLDNFLTEKISLINPAIFLLFLICVFLVFI